MIRRFSNWMNQQPNIIKIFIEIAWRVFASFIILGVFLLCGFVQKACQLHYFQLLLSFRHLVAIKTFEREK